MLAPSVLQPRKSEVKHGVRHREQPRKQEARGNTQTATPPQAQARPRQSPGNAEPPTRARAPACARARQRAPGPQRMPGPQHARARQRMPEPPTHARAPARAGTKTWWVRCRPCSGEPSPQRTPGRKPGSGALIEPTIGLRDANRATRRVPTAKNRQSCPAVVNIDNSSQPQGQNARLFALPKSPYAHNRQKRPFPTSETAKNRLF